MVQRVQTGPKRSPMVKNIWVYHFGPFWTLLGHFGMLTSLPCLAIFVVLLVRFFGTPFTKCHNIQASTTGVSRQFLNLGAIKTKVLKT